RQLRSNFVWSGKITATVYKHGIRGMRKAPTVAPHGVASSGSQTSGAAHRINMQMDMSFLSVIIWDSRSTRGASTMSSGAKVRISIFRAERGGRADLFSRQLQRGVALRNTGRLRGVTRT